MLSDPKRPEIDHRTIKLIVGVIALTLASLTWIFSRTGLTSISASYWEGGWSQTFFIGFLFATSAFLLAYNGRARDEMILAKLAAVAAAGVALFPCKCVTHTQPLAYLHYFAAAVMFSVLAWFSYGFYRRARKKGHSRAHARAFLYLLCALAIGGAMVALAIHGIATRSNQGPESSFVFYSEAVALIAFGISWLLASHTLPGITREDERFSPLRQQP